MNINKFSFLVLFSCLFIACDRSQCETDNPIFLNNEVTSAVYQNELANQIQSITNPKTLRFWLADYFEKDDKHYFVFYIQNDALCAQTVVNVAENNTKFADVLKVKGKSRFNAEFKGLTFDITQNKQGNFEFHYTGHESIID